MPINMYSCSMQPLRNFIYSIRLEDKHDKSFFVYTMLSLSLGLSEFHHFTSIVCLIVFGYPIGIRLVFYSYV